MTRRLAIWAPSILAMLGVVGCSVRVVAPPSSPVVAPAPPPTATPAPAPPPAVATPAPTGYAIRFQRPAQPGAKARVDVVTTIREEKRTRIGQRVVQSQAKVRRVELQGLRTVTAVDARGRPLAGQLQIARLVVIEDGASRPLAPPGSVVTITRGEPPIVMVNGQPMAEGDVELLDAVINTDPPREISDDEVFGTPTPQVPGASWPVNSQLAAQDLSANGMLVSPQALQGQVTFTGIEQVEGIECAALQARMAAEGFQLAGLPNGAQMIESHLEARMRGCLPTDTAAPDVGGEMHMTFRGRLSVPTPAGMALVDMVMERQRRERVLPMP